VVYFLAHFLKKKHHIIAVISAIITQRRLLLVFIYWQKYFIQEDAKDLFDALKKMRELKLKQNRQ
jgi:hypothetical protein